MAVTLDKNISVLVVDDDEVDRMALKRALKGTELKASITEATDADSALTAIEDRTYDCFFLDYNLPGKNGLQLTKEIRELNIKVPIIVLTGQGSEQTAVDLMKAGASDYLPKSKLSSEALSRLIRSATRVYQAEALIDSINQNVREKNRLLEKQNKELEQQRRYIYQQNLKLQEVSRLKSEFLATMSHELRTPLNAIIGFSQILLNNAKSRKEHSLATKQHDMVDRILANGKSLLELINDVLSFSKIEAGRLTLEPAPLDIAKLVQTIVEDLRSLASQKSLGLETEIDLQDPQITNDAGRLRQVLVNLLSNAIKFTDEGSVRVLLSGAGDNIRLSVVDTGCGIKAEDQTYIFDPFHQADQKVTRRHAGTGLGLAITYSLVKMMHGSITIDSQVGEGSAFVVEIPRVVVAESEKLQPSEIAYLNTGDLETQESS